MKNRKTLKSSLSCIMIAAIFICMIMMIMDMCVSGSSWFMFVKNGQLTLDWHYAGIYFGFMLVALITWLIRYCACSRAELKENHCCTCLMCEWATFLGIVIAIIALFLPIGMEASSMSEEIYDKSRMIAGVVMAWVGMPLAFIASVYESAHAKPAK